MQHGKGADMAPRSAGGSSGSLCRAAGSQISVATTAILATVFFFTSIGLTFFGTLHGKPQA
jgi:preprotein translocase subunit SecG